MASEAQTRSPVEKLSISGELLCKPLPVDPDADTSKQLAIHRRKRRERECAAGQSNVNVHLVDEIGVQTVVGDAIRLLIVQHLQYCQDVTGNQHILLWRSQSSEWDRLAVPDTVLKRVDQCLYCERCASVRMVFTRLAPDFLERQCQPFALCCSSFGCREPLDRADFVLCSEMKIPTRVFRYRALQGGWQVADFLRSAARRARNQDNSFIHFPPLPVVQICESFEDRFRAVAVAL